MTELEQLGDRVKSRIEFTDEMSNMSGRDAMHVNGITIDAANAHTRLIIQALLAQNLRLAEALEEIAIIERKMGYPNSRISDRANSTLASNLAKMKELAGE